MNSFRFGKSCHKLPVEGVGAEEQFNLFENAFAVSVADKLAAGVLGGGRNEIVDRRSVIIDVMILQKSDAHAGGRTDDESRDDGPDSRPNSSENVG